jgi:hypothetical protein
MLVKAIASQLWIDLMSGESMEGTPHDRVGHRHDRQVLATTAGQALMQGRQIGSLQARTRGKHHAQLWRVLQAFERPIDVLTHQRSTECFFNLSIYIYLLMLDDVIMRED